MGKKQEFDPQYYSGSTWIHPPFLHRIYSVWFRHMRVYTKNLIANGFPPFLEPLIFLFAIGLGLGKYVTTMAGLPYIQFLASGLLVTAAMFTAAFECSYGTFIRMEFEKTYNGMLAAPITVNDLLIGEIVWAGTKGLFFSTAVLTVITLFGILSPQLFLVVPLIGFLTGAMFATVALLVTSFVKDINQFNFFFTGFISPMFFFCGVVFSIEKLPGWIRPVVEILPLTHPVRVMRAMVQGDFEMILLWDGVYIPLITVGTAWLAFRRLRKRLIT